MREYGNVVVGEKLTCCESSERGCVIIMELSIALAPQFRSFSSNVIPQTAKNTALELGNLLNCSPAILMHKSPNCFHIFRG